MENSWNRKSKIPFHGIPIFSYSVPWNATLPTVLYKVRKNNNDDFPVRNFIVRTKTDVNTLAIRPPDPPVSDPWGSDVEER
jgi:hypothetical protein